MLKLAIPVLGAFVFANVARADVRFFVSNPTANSVDFLADANSGGLIPQVRINFANHPLGVLNPAQFSSAGVTISTTGAVGVQEGNGSQSGNTTDPGGIGEGLLPEPARFLHTGFGGVATVDFVLNPPASAFGLMTADMFRWEANVPAARIELFDTAGNLIGTSNSFDRSFEFDYLYFMGAVDDQARIARVRFTNFGNFGDSIYITRAWIARACPSDFNDDGIVDFFDYLDYVETFASGVAESDFNADGVVDFFDYLDFVARFATGC